MSEPIHYLLSQLNLNQQSMPASINNKSTKGLGNVPDVPNNGYHNVSTVLADEVANGIKKSVGKQQTPPRNNIPKLSLDEPVPFTFRCYLTENQIISWDAVFWSGNLYIHLPNNMVMEGSKEAFIELLEYAEEELVCNNVVICFKKNRTDKNALMRLFMFLGFVLLNPNHQLLPGDAASDDMIFMAYNVTD